MRSSKPRLNYIRMLSYVDSYGNQSSIASPVSQSSYSETVISNTISAISGQTSGGLITVGETGTALSSGAVQTSIVIVNVYPTISFSTVFSTDYVTVSHCPSTVTPCPADATSVITSVTFVSISLCPTTYTSSSLSVGRHATSSMMSSLTTSTPLSTVYVTHPPGPTITYYSGISSTSESSTMPTSNTPASYGGNLTTSPAATSASMSFSTSYGVSSTSTFYASTSVVGPSSSTGVLLPTVSSSTMATFMTVGPFSNSSSTTPVLPSSYPHIYSMTNASSLTTITVLPPTLQPSTYGSVLISLSYMLNISTTVPTAASTASVGTVTGPSQPSMHTISWLTTAWTLSEASTTSLRPQGSTSTFATGYIIIVPSGYNSGTTPSAASTATQISAISTTSSSRSASSVLSYTTQIAGSTTVVATSSPISNVASTASSSSLQIIVIGPSTTYATFVSQYSPSTLPTNPGVTTTGNSAGSSNAPGLSSSSAFTPEYTVVIVTGGSTATTLLPALTAVTGSAIATTTSIPTAYTVAIQSGSSVFFTEIPIPVESTAPASIPVASSTLGGQTYTLVGSFVTSVTVVTPSAGPTQSSVPDTITSGGTTSPVMSASTTPIATLPGGLPFSAITSLAPSGVEISIVYPDHTTIVIPPGFSPTVTTTQTIVSFVSSMPSILSPASLSSTLSTESATIIAGNYSGNPMLGSPTANPSMYYSNMATHITHCSAYLGLFIITLMMLI